jgi:polysaccharide export outer membrane protein
MIYHFQIHKKIIFILFLCFFLCSCTHKKNLIYFQGSIKNSEINKSYTPILRPDDLLSITIMGLDIDAVRPFNLPVNTSVNQNMGGYTQGTPSPPGYLIDSNGNIDFPVIGKIKLGGLNRGVAIDLLKEQLKPYLNNPTIILRILNYKITVLGEVRNPGTFTIPNERITLLEALGIAGDLQITGMRKNILVIREVDGKRIETIVDLTSKELFSSPVFYLQQNDIVYVEPNRAKINSSAVNPGNLSLILSAVSLFITLAILIKK